MTNDTIRTGTRATERPFRLRKLPARYAGIVMPLVLSVFMTCVVSAIATLRSVGITDGVYWLWLQNWALSWALSWVVAFPTLLIILPLVRRVVGLLVASPQS